LDVIVWVADGTWPATVDAARRFIPDSAQIALLHVTEEDVAAAAHGAFAGLLGRGYSHGLGRPATQVERRGRIERDVVELADGADLLVCARDGDRSRPGPHSLAPPTRFVVDHVRCPVLLVWA
jgi:hypothetical protein